MNLIASSVAAVISVDSSRTYYCLIQEIRNNRSTEYPGGKIGEYIANGPPARQQRQRQHSALLSPIAYASYACPPCALRVDWPTAFRSSDRSLLQTT